MASTSSSVLSSHDEEPPSRAGSWGFATTSRQPRERERERERQQSFSFSSSPLPSPAFSSHTNAQSRSRSRPELQTIDWASTADALEAEMALDRAREEREQQGEQEREAEQAREEKRELQRVRKVRLFSLSLSRDSRRGGGGRWSAGRC